MGASRGSMCWPLPCLGPDPGASRGRVGEHEGAVGEPSSARTKGRRSPTGTLSACWEKTGVWDCRPRKGSSGPISRDSEHLPQPSDGFPPESSKCLTAGVCLLPQAGNSVRARARPTPSDGELPGASTYTSLTIRLASPKANTTL